MLREDEDSEGLPGRGPQEVRQEELTIAADVDRLPNSAPLHLSVSMDSYFTLRRKGAKKSLERQQLLDRLPQIGDLRKHCFFKIRSRWNEALRCAQAKHRSVQRVH